MKDVMKNVITAFLLIVSSWGTVAQDSDFETIQIRKQPLSPPLYLDSLKHTFVQHRTGNEIDKRWLHQLVSDQSLFEQMEEDVASAYRQESVSYEELPTELLKERLKAMDAKSLFKIEYHESIEQLIKTFLKKRSKSYERLMALSEYYFPMFEASLAKHNVPLELKYLAIVESTLNPKATSRVGATGLWQFMYPTGKQYGLEVSSYIDERSDPVKSTDAAAQYLSDLYNVFGNWELALASYNYGPGNVSKAIRRAGGETDYWKIRKNLPKETQGYVPALIATMYIYEYHKQHNIIPERAKVPFVQTDTIHIKEAISFKTLAGLLDMSEAEIEILNPKYKTGIIPSYSYNNGVLRLPLDKIAVFASNEKKIYDYLAYEKAYQNNEFSSEMQEEISYANSEIKPSDSQQFYTVKKGDNLGRIANDFGLDVNELKQLNGISSNNIQAGQKLLVSGGASKSKVIQTKSSKISTYTVKKGDTLADIAKRYNHLTVNKLMKMNNISNAKNIKPGMKLKING